MLNDYQRTVLKTYAGGDYAHMEEELDSLRSHFAFCKEVGKKGDTLFAFLMIELSDAEHCETLEVALQRLHVAREDIKLLQQAISELRGKEKMELDDASE